MSQRSINVYIYIYAINLYVEICLDITLIYVDKILDDLMI
jgi:hypothetical protein